LNPVAAAPFVPAALAPAPVALPPDVERMLHEMENLPLLETDGSPMDSPWHRQCMNLLIESVLHWWRARDDFYVGGNMFVYFNLDQARNLDYRGPDFFVVNRGVALQPERRYWAIWRENGRYPDVIIELASPTTIQEDRTTKFDIYRQTFRTRNYFIYDSDERRLDGWELDPSHEYQPLTPNERGWLWCDELGLWVGTWDGEFQRNNTTWLRFYDREGNVVLTSEEAALRRADDEKRRADALEAELARLKAAAPKKRKRGSS
jgi:Uma2 family endonuclease